MRSGSVRWLIRLRELERIAADAREGREDLRRLLARLDQVERSLLEDED